MSDMYSAAGAPAPMSNKVSFAQAWKAMTSTKGWLPFCIRAGLLMLIPIFGQIVVFGCIARWCKQLAYNPAAPAPTRLFDNSDGRLYKEGIWVWGITTLAGIAIAFIISILTGILSVIPLIGAILSFILSIATLFIVPATYVMGYTSVMFGSFEEGWNFNRIIDAAKKNTSEFFMLLFKMFLIMLVFAIVATIVTLVVMLVATIVLTIFGVSFVEALQVIDSSTASAGQMIAAIGVLTILITMVTIVVVLVLSPFNAMIYELSFHMIGQWARTNMLGLPPVGYAPQQPSYGYAAPQQQAPNQQNPFTQTPPQQ